MDVLNRKQSHSHMAKTWLVHDSTPQALLLTEICQTNISLRIQISNYIHVKESSVITYPCANTNGDLVKQSL